MEEFSLRQRQLQEQDRQLQELRQEQDRQQQEKDRQLQELRQEQDRQLQEKDRQLQELRQEQDRQLQELRQEIDRQLQEKDRQLQEKDRQLQELRQEQDRQLQELRQEQDRQLRLMAGTYYSTIDAVVDTTVMESPKLDDYKLLCRNYEVGKTNIKCRSGGAGDGVDPYQETFEILNENLSAADGSNQSRCSIETEKKIIMWPVSVTRQTRAGDLAHLVPAPRKHADSYFFVVGFLFGYDDRRDTKTIRRLIHGSRREATKKRKPNSNEVEAKKRGGRVRHTGIKHMVSNFVRLPGQTEYWDTAPCILLLPICELEFARNWQGEGYSAIMLIDKWTNVELQDVASGVGFQDHAQEADEADLKKAMGLFMLYTKGIAYAVKNRPEGIDFNDYNTEGLMLPKFKFEEGTKVRKVTFAAQHEESGHPAPDPILLVCKSSVVWARRKGWTLAAAAEPQDIEDNSSWDTFREIEFQKVLAKREARAKDGFNPIGIDIICPTTVP